MCSSCILPLYILLCQLVPNFPLDLIRLVNAAHAGRCKTLGHIRHNPSVTIPAQQWEKCLYWGQYGGGRVGNPDNGLRDILDHIESAKIQGINYLTSSKSQFCFEDGDSVGYFLAHLKRLDVREIDWSHLLIEAAEWGKEKPLLLLLKHIKDLQIEDIDWRSCLCRSTGIDGTATRLVLEYVQETDLDAKAYTDALFSAASFTEPLSEFVNFIALHNVQGINYGYVLTEISRYRNTEGVRLLFKNGKRLKIDSSHFNAGLLAACFLPFDGALEIVKFLLGHGVDVNAEGVFGGASVKDIKYPLHAASWHGHAKVVKLLLSKGANVNAPLPATFCGSIISLAFDGGWNRMRGNDKWGSSVPSMLCMALLLLCNGADETQVSEWIRDKRALLASGDAMLHEWLDKLDDGPSGCTETCGVA